MVYNKIKWVWGGYVSRVESIPNRWETLVSSVLGITNTMEALSAGAESTHDGEGGGPVNTAPRNCNSVADAFSLGTRDTRSSVAMTLYF